MLRPATCVVVLVTQSWPTLCEPMNCSLPGSSVHGILQARTLEWVAIPFSRWSSQPKDQTRVSCIASNSFTVWATRDAPVPYPFNHSSASWRPDLPMYTAGLTLWGAEPPHLSWCSSTYRTSSGLIRPGHTHSLASSPFSAISNCSGRSAPPA